MRMCNCCGNEISAAKRPGPVSSGRSSRRVTERPTNFSFGFASGGAIAAFLILRGRRRLQRRASAGRRAYRLHDVLIAGAAAQIGREHVDKLVIADVRLAFQHAGDQHEKARRAEAALQAVMLHEGALQRVELVAVGQAFDGADLFAVGLYREHQARAHRLAIDQHGAGAAHAVFAADMRAGLSAILADRIDQRAARLDPNGVARPLIVSVIVVFARSSGLLRCLPQSRADAARRRRNFVDGHAERRERVIDRR